MIPFLRQAFNKTFTRERYSRLLREMEHRCGTPVKFRLCETPCFFPKTLLDRMARFGEELIRQLDTEEYRKASLKSIPPEFNVPNEDDHPLFVQVDFGLVRSASGELIPKLVELQGFPSLYGYQAMLSQAYIDVFDLDDNLKYLLGGLNWQSYQQLLGQAILGGRDPENVIIMEIDPLQQKTLPDFLVTKKLFGIKTVAITDIEQRGMKLFYKREGKHIPIERIYNRVIVDELVRKNQQLPFRLTGLEVEWAGHPNWYFRMSKFSLPFLHHECVPESYFLDRAPHIQLDRFILKPLFSFAGLGVIMNPTAENIAAIPEEARSNYILQERMTFEPVIETPHGSTKAEIRIMYVWQESLAPVMTIVRMGRGMMMGVDQNRDMEWVGASAGLFP